MAVFASVLQTGIGILDGMPYCTNKILPAVEGELFNQSSPPFATPPLPVAYNDAIVCVVTLTLSGANPGTNSSYVVLQTDLFGDNNFVDVAGCVWTATTGSAIFVLSTGVPGPLGIQFTRQPGVAPQTTGANGMALGGRFRFIGKSSLTSGSSSSSSSGSPGGPLQVSCNIRYKLQGIR